MPWLYPVSLLTEPMSLLGKSLKLSELLCFTCGMGNECRFIAKMLLWTANTANINSFS